MRKKLTENRTYYVRVDGNNANDGLSNTSGGAFASVAGAVGHVQNNIDTQGYGVTIRIADGTYSHTQVNLLANTVGGGSLDIIGNTTTPSNVVLVSPTGSTGFYANGFTSPLQLSGFKSIGFGNSLYSCATIISNGNSYLQFGNIDFGSWGSGSHIKPNLNSLIEATANYTVSGTAGCHVDAQFNSTLVVSGYTVTVLNTPKFHDSFAMGYHTCRVDYSSATITGGATGQRWRNGNLSIHRTGLGNSSATYFPGNVNGSLGSNSLYI